MNEGNQSKLLKLTEETIERTIKDGLTTNNLDIVLKLSKIKHYEKEDENMYGNYSGRGPGHGSYGNYGRDEYGRENYGEYGNYSGSYGRRGYDRKYRGDDSLDRMSGEYGRYMESRERYGAGQESDKSFHYILEALKDFVKVLHEEAETPEQKQQITQALQSVMR